MPPTVAGYTAFGAMADLRRAEEKIPSWRSAGIPVAARLDGSRSKPFERF
jgi:hypothetical protein